MVQQMNHSKPENLSRLDRRNHSVCFRDSVVKKDDLGNSSTTLSSVWDIEVKIRDLEQEETNKGFLRVRGKQCGREKAPLVYFRKSFTQLEGTTSHYTKSDSVNTPDPDDEDDDNGEDNANDDDDDDDDDDPLLDEEPEKGCFLPEQTLFLPAEGGYGAKHGASQVPIAGALFVATCLGTPVIALTGLKLGMFAAVGGGIMGFATGKMFAEHE